MTRIPRRNVLRHLQGDLDADVESCARSIKEDRDVDKSTAIAICQDMKNRGVLEAFLEADPQDEDAELAALAEFRNPGDIRRVDLDGDAVRYENVMLLAPGAWTDAGSRSTAIYSPEGIRASADNWVDPATGDAVDEIEINLLHGPALHGAATLGDIGTIPASSITVDDSDRMYGDLEIHGESAASQLAVELMDEVLEAADDPGRETPPVGPSVEIVQEESEFDDATGATRLTEMWFSGVGLVFNPASRPVEIEHQARERAIAMADEAGYDHAGLVLHRDDAEQSGETPLNTSRHAGGMTQSQRQRINKLLGEMQRVLQEDGDIELVQTLVEQYRQDGGDMEASATEFVAWVEENSDVSEGDLQEVLEAYLADVGADSLEETPVQGLAEWAEEQMGNPEEDEEGEDGGDGMSEEDLREAVDTIGNFASELESVKDMLSDYREDVDEQVSTLEDEIEEKDRRLQKLEDQPVRQAQEHRDGESFLDEDGDEASATEHEDVMLT